MKGLLWSVLRTGGSSLCVPHTVTQDDQSWTPKNRRSTALQTYVCLQATKSCDTTDVFLNQRPAQRILRIICIHMQFIDYFLTELCQTFWSKCSKSCLNQFGLLFFNLFRSITRADLPLQMLLGKRMAAVALLGCHGAGCQVCMQLPAARLWGTAHSIMLYMHFCGTKYTTPWYSKLENHVSWKEQFRCAEISNDWHRKQNDHTFVNGRFNKRLNGKNLRRGSFYDLSKESTGITHLQNRSCVLKHTDIIPYHRSNYNWELRYREFNSFVNLTILHWQKKKVFFPVQYTGTLWDPMEQAVCLFSHKAEWREMLNAVCPSLIPDCQLVQFWWGLTIISENMLTQWV